MSRLPIGKSVCPTISRLMRIVIDSVEVWSGVAGSVGS